ncbi:sodium:dicarboxylate symporter [Ammonifex degensii KC4]|uniref:Sodium:dicarboxylate symporter n=1 Tax=Ammonifex degensii (strain DSM 10501 / KC4) TaxID=429009 RepID=C9RAL0_AMMDK|nr:dicarboxylate/amino acid:cation symporter [Ammonifex degensii]ACX51287.1 sodium:dicarboxylate symporter [Ammonifex degensii KC4]
MGKDTKNGANRKRVPLWAQLLVGMVVGIAIGAIWPKFGATLQPVGTAFIKAIKMIVIPLVFSAVTLGVYKMGNDIKQLGRLGILAFAWFYLATSICVALGIGLNAIFHPAAGAALQPTGKLPENLATSIDWVKFLLDIIPDNVIAAMANQKMLPTLFFAICFGLSLAAIGEKSRYITNLLEGILNAMFKLTGGIITTAPIAVAAIMAWIFATQRGSVILGLFKLVGVMYLGVLIVMVLFWIIVSMLGQNPFATTKRILEPLLLAFTTASSEITLPRRMEILEKHGIPDRIVSFVLPLGYSFNLDGAALYQSLAVCFLVEAYGLHLDTPTILTILLTTLIANKGGAGIPAAALVVIATVLTTLGLPIEGIAILAGVDRLMDMGRTAINVFGNTVAALVLHKFSGNQVT